MHLQSLTRMWPWPLLLLSLIGLGRRRSIAALPLLHLLAIPLLALSAQPRFVVSAVPALAIFATVPIVLASGRGARLALAAVMLVGIAWCGKANVGDLVLPYDAHLGAEKDAGDWIATHSSPTDPVMDRKPYIAFYAQRPYRLMPDTSYDEIVDFARRTGVHYLVVEQGVAKVFRPQLLPLLQDPAFLSREPRLEMVYVGGRFEGYGIGVFRVLKPGELKTGRPPKFNVTWLRSSVVPRGGTRVPAK
jgi:hypothetical protein